MSSIVDTMEDNYRAFKLFSIMDVNRDGRISIEEVNRMLMGKRYHASLFLLIFYDIISS